MTKVNGRDDTDGGFGESRRSIFRSRKNRLAPIRSNSRLAGALCFALLSVAGEIPAGAQFQPPCTLPFHEIQQHHSIDDACRIEGNSLVPAQLAQNTAKNNFCAPEPAVDLTIDDFAALQRTAESAGVTFGTSSHLPANRQSLRGIYKTASGEKVGEGSLVRLTASVSEAHYSNVLSGESVNCQTPGQENNDFDVHLVASPLDDACKSVVAEVSPHFRPAAWTPLALSRLPDRRVRFTGQLFFDASHKPCSVGAFRGGPARISVWEIHPVYAIDICSSSSEACDGGKGWVALDQFISHGENITAKTTTRSDAATTVIAVAAPRVVPTGGRADVEIALQDASGKPVAAGQDLAIKVRAPGATLDTDTVVIRKGELMAKLGMTFNQPGSVEIRAVPTSGVPNVSGGSAPPISVGAAEEEDVKPPLTVKYWISPQPLYAGGEGMLAAQLINGDGRALLTKNTIEISFPGLQAELRPPRLYIEGGSTSGSARISNPSPLAQSVHPLLPNAVLNGVPIGTEELQLEFRSRITGVRVLTPPETPKFRRSEIHVTVELFDVEGNQAASDKKRTIMLSSNHPDIGDLENKDLVFDPGDVRPKTTEYFPNREGKVTIHAVSALSDLREIPGEIEFLYVWWYFAFVAVLAGIAGGFLRWYKKTRRRAEELPVYFALGALTGVISYYVLSALLGKLVVLQDVGLETKIGEAVVWGVIGGVLGPHLLADRITKLVSNEP